MDKDFLSGRKGRNGLMFLPRPLILKIVNWFHMTDATDSKSDESMPIYAKVFLGILFLALSFCFLIIADILFFDRKYSHRFVYGSDCSFVVPNGYSIIYDLDKKMYSIKVEVYQDYYLYDGRRGLTTMYSSISSPAYFENECNAKAALKDYLQEGQPRVKNYRRINE